MGNKPYLALRNTSKLPIKQNGRIFQYLLCCSTHGPMILSGDFNPEKIKPLIEEKFGKWRSGRVPEKLVLNEDPFKGREVYKKRMTPVKVGIRIYRTIPKNHPDEIAFEICANLLSNSSSTGLLDQLRTDNKLLFSGTMNNHFEEIGGTFHLFCAQNCGSIA